MVELLIWDTKKWRYMIPIWLKLMILFELEEFVNIIEIKDYVALAFYIVGIISCLWAFKAGFWTLPTWIKRVEKDIEYLTKSFDEFKTEANKKFDRIFDSLNSTKPTLESGSPYTLNKLGEKISKEIDAGNIAEKIVGMLGDNMEGKTPFEIQELSINYVQSQFEPDENDLKKIQDSAYNNGTGIQQVKDVIAIKLWDDLFKKFGIPVPSKE